MTAPLSCTEDERKGRGRPSAYKSLWRGRGEHELSRDLVPLRQKLVRVFLFTFNVLRKCDWSRILYIYVRHKHHILTIHRYYILIGFIFVT